tara:strand:+ start:1412 stop:1582 length:171 start_codon:yes stop_codon:yes gene_type:complete
MEIINAKYYSSDGQNVSVNVTIDGITMSVPLDPANRHYAEIMRQVAAGTLTIADAD